MKKVLGMGNALVDIMTQLENDDFLEQHNLPKGSMQLVDFELAGSIIDKAKHLKKTKASGGSAANTIHGLAQLGVETSFLGKVGKDELGKFFEKDLIDANIKPALLKSESKSGMAVALVSPDSERTFATFLGAAVEMTAKDLKNDIFKSHHILHIEGYLVQNHDLVEAAVKMAKENKLLVSLDLASYNVVEGNLDFLKRITQDYVDILFANEEEAKSFTGKEPEEALHAIAEMVEFAIVKVGAKGAMVKNQGKVYKVDAIKAKSIDTTGAGDLFASGFLFGLIHGMSLDKCAQIGTITAGNVIEVIGAKMDEGRWAMVMEKIENIWG